MRRLTLIFVVAALLLSCEKCNPPLENTPPIIKSIHADPDSVFTGDTVKLSFDYFDAEGDSIDGESVGVIRRSIDDLEGFSVRCVKDE